MTLFLKTNYFSVRTKYLKTAFYQNNVQSMIFESENDNKIVANVFPLGMQNSSITLYDDEGNRVNEVEELSCDSNEQAIIPSAINVESSSDVIVGPVTQFHGPVTIYQQVNGRTQSLTNRDESNSENLQNGKSIETYLEIA